MGRAEDIDGFARAAWKKHAVRILYRDGDGRQSNRVIEPERVYGSRSGTAYVRAYCRLRGENRTFRLDRISWWEELPGAEPIELKATRTFNPLLRTGPTNRSAPATTRASSGCLVGQLREIRSG